MTISEHDAYLRWSCAFLCEFADLVDDGIGGGLEPCWWSARVRDGGGADALAVAVEATHDGGVAGSVSDETALLCAVQRTVFD